MRVPGVAGRYREEGDGVQSHSSQREQANGPASQAGSVSSVPALTRLCATPQAGEVAKEVLREFQGKII